MNCQFEKLGFLFDSLKQNGVRRVVMAGAISRPQFDQSKLDQYTLSIMPKLSAKLIQGDNELLLSLQRNLKKMVIKLLGPQKFLPDLLLKPGFIVGSTYETISRDIEKADKILKILAPEDIGQGVVVENGLVLGIETLQGTNELLKFVTKTSSHLRKD